MKLKTFAVVLTALAVSTGASYAQLPGGCPGPDHPMSPKGKSVKMKATFTNETDFPLNMFWIDYDGKRVPYGRVGPGQTAYVNTFVGHPWAFVTDHGLCVDLYIASKAERHHVVDEQ